MFLWTLRVPVVLWLCLLHCIICNNSEHDPQQKDLDVNIFYKSYSNPRHDDASGKALEDICDCDSIEIITSKVIFLVVCLVEKIQKYSINEI